MGHSCNEWDIVIFELSKSQVLIDRCAVIITRYYPDLFNQIPTLVEKILAIKDPSSAEGSFIKVLRARQVHAEVQALNTEVSMREFKRMNKGKCVPIAALEDVLLR